MEFWTAVEVVRRRWYVFVPTLLAFALLGAFLVSQVKPVYKAAGKMAVRGPNAKPAEDDVLTNDFASMDRIQLLNIIADIAVDSNFKDEVIASGGTSSYAVLPPFGNTPNLSLSVTAPTPDQAKADYSILVKTLNTELQTRQQEMGAAPSTFLTAYELTSPKNAFPETGARTKAIIVVAIVGFLVAIGLSFLVDSALAARARRRGDDDDDEEGELVSLVPTSRSPLDELADLEPDDPDASAGDSSTSMRW